MTKSCTNKGVPRKKTVKLAHKKDIILFPYTRPPAIKIPKNKPKGIDKTNNLIVTQVPSNKGGKIYL